MQTQRIIVALDGSELAREGFEYALDLAAAAGLPLSILHVREPRTMTAIGEDEAPDDEFLTPSEAIESCRAAAAFREISLDVDVQAGDLKRLLHARSLPGTLLVVGVKGRFSRVGMGSSTRWLLQHARGPVMVVTDSSDRQIGRFVAVVDGTAGSVRTMPFAIDLGDQTSRPVSIVVAAPTDKLDDVIAAATDVAPDVPVLAHPTTQDETVAQVVASRAAEMQHSLFVIGAYSDSWVQQLIHGGGTTGQLIRMIRGPVVLVP